MRHVFKRIHDYTVNRHSTNACQFNGKPENAWQRAHGALPAGMKLTHACENHSCTNIKHLYLTTKDQK